MSAATAIMTPLVNKNPKLRNINPRIPYLLNASLKQTHEFIFVDKVVVTVP